MANSLGLSPEAYQSRTNFLGGGEGSLMSGESLLDMHEGNMRLRSCLVGAYVNAVIPISQQFIGNSDKGLVLEVASGTGYYSQLLRNNGARELANKLVSVEINQESILTGIRCGNYGLMALQDANALAFSENSFDGGVSFSGFDSLPDLRNTLRQALNVIRAGKNLVLFQEADAHQYTFGLNMNPEVALGLYRRALLVAVDRIREAKIIFDDFVEGVGVESIEAVKKRVDGKMLQTILENKPLIVGNNLGTFRMRKKGGEGKENSEILEEFKKHQRANLDLSGTEIGEDEVLEWVKMHVMVIQKTGDIIVG